MGYNGVKPAPILVRFNKNYNILGNGCWKWKLKLNDKGYGRLGKAYGRGTMAHRVSYRLFIGELEDDMLVCHKCDNPWCVNPFHLFKGTGFDNMKDARDKGRRPSGDHPSEKTYKEGCRCPDCKALRKAAHDKWYKEYKAKNGIKDKATTHGTVTMYRKYKCRCELCTLAYKESRAREAEAKRKKIAEQKLLKAS